MRITGGSENIFIDCGFPAAEAENLRLRADMVIALASNIAEKKLTAAKAAKLMGVPLNRVSELTAHRVDLFSLDNLVEMLAASGLRADLSVKPFKSSRKVA